MVELNPYTKQVESNSYLTGAKRYGNGMRMNATSGPVSAAGRTGYAERDAARLRRNARLKAASSYSQQPATGYTAPQTPTY